MPTVRFRPHGPAAPTFAKLERAVGRKAESGCGEEWHVGGVRYLDLSKDEGLLASDDFPSAHKVLTLKHASYEHEHEVRALGKSLNRIMPEEGAEILIEPHAFVDGVVVNPRASAWFFDLVTDAAAGHGMERCVKRSEITDLEEEAAEDEP